MKIAVVTDSTAYLPQETIERYQIRVMPIIITIDGESYQEGIDFSSAEFYPKLAAAKNFPQTAPPTLGAMESLFDDLVDEGYDTILAIHLTSGISGFVNNLQKVAENYKKANVFVYDSEITVQLMGYLVTEAGKMASEGRDIKDILARLDDLRASIGEYFIVDDLQNLVHGGRLSNASAFIGGLLKIKPILTFNDEHKIIATEKIRSMNRAVDRIFTLFGEQQKQVDYPLRLLVLHANFPEKAEEMVNRLHETYPNYTIDVGLLGPTMGAYLGEKSLALAWIKDFDKV